MYRSNGTMPVLYVWWYDTVAILDDYSDSYGSDLPAGEEFTIMEGDENGVEFYCRPRRSRRLRKRVLPKGTQIRNLFCWPRHFGFIVTSDRIHEKCIRSDAI